jgi:hypothetical protein
MKAQLDRSIEIVRRTRGGEYWRNIMENRKRKINDSAMEVQLIISDTRSEIDLKNRELLKLVFGQPGACVRCITGVLWLTQESDLHDHLLIAGQSFTIEQQGIVLVQGLPCGKALVLPPASFEAAGELLYNKINCSSQSQ